MTDRAGIYVASRVRHADTWRAFRDENHIPIISSWIDEAGEAGMALAAGVPVYIVLADDVVLEARTSRPLGSWINHPLVKRASITAALNIKLSQHASQASAP